MDKRTQKIGVICSIVQIILSIICLIYSAINQENIIMWVLFLCSGILSLSSNISRNNKKEDEWGSANSSLSSWTQKTEHRKTDRWPAPCAYSQRSFLSPKSKKSIAMTKEKAIFSVQWYCALIWGRLFEKTGRSLQLKGSELFAILQNSLFRVSYLPLFETATTVCCNSSLSSV